MIQDEDFSDIAICYNCTRYNVKSCFCSYNNATTTQTSSCSYFQVKTFDEEKAEEYKPKKVSEVANLLTKASMIEWNKRGDWVIKKDGSAKYLLQNNRFITTGKKIYTIYRYEGGYYKPDGENFIKSFLQKELGRKYDLKINLLNEIIDYIRRETLGDIDVLAQESKNLICVENGIINLDTKEFKSHDPDIIFTQQIPTRYNPSADCPKIKAFINQILEPDDVPVFQELLGFLLLRDYSIKKAFIFIGESDAGKTQLIKLIIKFIGVKNTSGESLHRIIKDKFSLINLKDKLLNSYDDLDSQDLNDIGIFKVVTGNGWITAEHKFGERIQFQNYAKLLFACNAIFGLKDKDVDDEAYYGRWILFFFNNIIPRENQVKDISEKISTPEELSGLLNWALEGYERLSRQGFFSFKKTPEEIKALMQRGSNNIASFCQDCLEEAPGAWISKEDLYAAYSLYIQEIGGARQTKEKLGRDLPKLASYCLDSKQGSITGWRNIKLKQGTHTISLTISSILNSHARDNRESMISLIPQETKAFSELQTRLLYTNNKEAAVQDIIQSGFTDDQIEKWKGEGLIYEPRPGWLKLL